MFVQAKARISTRLATTGSGVLLWIYTAKIDYR
jgi:hypothetical protein